jgi:hypothetical protein
MSYIKHSHALGCSGFAKTSFWKANLATDIRVHPRVLEEPIKQKQAAWNLLHHH